MRFIIAPLALLFSASLASSQTDKINFRTLALDNSKFPELWATASEKAVPLAFSNSQPSTALKADKANPMKIFKGPLDDKGIPSDPAPSLVPLPATTSILLLAWMKDEKPEFLAVEDAFTTAKTDDWLVINHSDKPLTVQIGATDKPLTVAPNSQLAFKCTAPVGSGAAATVASQQADGAWKTIYTSYLPIYPDKRGIILAAQNGERIKVNYISDELAPKSPAKPPTKPAAKR